MQILWLGIVPWIATVPLLAMGQEEQATPADAVAKAREFVGLLEKMAIGPAFEQFDETMKEKLPAAVLAQAWSDIRRSAGPFKRQVRTRTEKVRQHDVVYVTCRFERAFIDIEVVFDQEGHVAGLWFHPSAEAEPPTTIVEREVIVGQEPWTLPGTLTRPQGNGPWPAVVLVHGSGPHDRDETVGANKPFRDLAWGLAEHGIAVLRYEKRTQHYKDRKAEFKTTITVKEETIDDALAAVKLLRASSDVDPERIYVVGHSLGGMLVPRIAARDRSLAGFAILAAPARSLEQTIIDEAQYEYELDGQIDEKDQKKLNLLGAQAQAVSALKASGKADGNQTLLGAPAAYWLDLRDYDPPPAAAKLERPLLIVHGGRDYQVTDEDFDLWKKALGDRANVTFKRYAELNHLLIAGEGPSSRAEYNRPSRVDQRVIDDIAEWIAATHSGDPK